MKQNDRHVRQVFVRFDKRIDAALDRASEATGMRRATLVSWIIENHLRLLQQQETATSVDHSGQAPVGRSLESRLLLHGAASLYHLKIGRTVQHAPRNIGRAILLTLPVEVESQLRLLAEINDISLNHLRSSIVATFLLKNNMMD